METAAVLARPCQRVDAAERHADEHETRDPEGVDEGVQIAHVALRGVVHALYPSLGIGAARAVDYAGACCVRRPCIGPETPSTPCSTR